MTAPKERITRDDIEGKFREIQGEVDLIEDEAKNYAGIVAVVVVTTVVVIAFALGRRKGRKTRTVLEIRRV